MMAKKGWIVEFTKKSNVSSRWISEHKFRALPKKITVQIEASLIFYALKLGGAKFWREHGLHDYWMSACYAIKA